MGVFRDMLLILATRPHVTEADIIFSGISVTMLSEYIQRIDYMTLNDEELDYFGLSISAENIITEARNLMGKTASVIKSTLRDVFNVEYEVEKDEDLLSLEINVQLLNRVLSRFGLPMLVGYQGRVYSQVSDSHSVIIAELTGAEQSGSVSIEVIITKSDYNGNAGLLDKGFTQSISEVLYMTGVLDILMGEVPMPEDDWHISMDYVAQRAVSNAIELFFNSDVRAHMVHLTHTRKTFPEDVMPVILISCHCVPYSDPNAAIEHLDERYLIETLMAFDEEIRWLQNNILEILAGRGDVPDDLIMAMLILVNGDYEGDYEAMLYSVVAVSVLWNEDIEQAVIEAAIRL
jgi:hypothetical protein